VSGGVLKVAVGGLLGQALQRAALKHNGLTAEGLREAVDEVLGPPEPERIYIKKEPTMPKRCLKVESDDERDRLLAEHSSERLIEVRVPKSEELEYRRYSRAVGFDVDDDAPTEIRFLVDTATHKALVREYPFLAEQAREAERVAEEDAEYRRYAASMGFGEAT
jgi:hypothetical protein